MYKPYPGYAFVSGTYLRPKDTGGDDAVIASVKHIETGDKRLHIIRNPQFEFWVTKPPFRVQNIRLEREREDRVNRYICRYQNLWDAVARALGDDFPSRNKRIYQENPHIYGVDVGPLIRMKLEYMESVHNKIPVLDIGMLDIETSVIQEYGAQILCASYTDWKTRQTFEFINQTWCDVPIESYERRMAHELKPFLDGLNDKATKVWAEQPHTFHYIPCPDERELIIRLITTTIQHKPDLCGVWNIGYDIPYILKRAEFLEIDPRAIFCHPDLPEDLRYFFWKEDHSEVEHFTDVWHQVVSPGYTRWYDPMCLYSRLRKVQGRENLYGLDFIATKIIGSGKMKFGQNNDHIGMQRRDQVGYCVYNCFDTILPCVIDRVTDDTTSMLVLTDVSELADFSKQSAMLRNDWYKYCRTVIHSVPGSVPPGITQGQKYDRFIWNKGGAVLNPNLLINRGSAHLKETALPTALNLLVNDIDATLNIGVLP